MTKLFRYKITCDDIDLTGITIAMNYVEAVRCIIEYFGKLDKISIELIGEFKNGFIPMNEFDIDDLDAGINLRKVDYDE